MHALTDASSTAQLLAVEAAVGAAPAMTGTVPGTPETAVMDLPTTGGWTSGTYEAVDDGAGTADEVVFYTDIEAPGTQPFSGEMGKYGTADGIGSVGNLVIGTTTDATLIASSEFPTGPGIRTHMAGGSGMAEVAGTIDGARCAVKAVSLASGGLRRVSPMAFRRLNPSNRRVRTRVHGGVGGVEP